MFKNKSFRVGSLTVFALLMVAGLTLATGTYVFVEKIIGPDGGKVNVQGDKLIVPAGALDVETPISMAMTSDDVSRVDYEFGPHGTVFNVPVELRLSWSTLRDMTSADLTLYYYEESSGTWVEETTAIWDDNGKKASLFIDHFSKYYFERR